MQSICDSFQSSHISFIAFHSLNLPSFRSAVGLKIYHNSLSLTLFFFLFPFYKYADLDIDGVLSLLMGFPKLLQQLLLVLQAVTGLLPLLKNAVAVDGTLLAILLLMAVPLQVMLLPQLHQEQQMLPILHLQTMIAVL